MRTLILQLVATAISLMLPAGAAVALSCNELQRLVDAKVRTLEADTALKTSDRAQSCKLQRRALEIKKQIIKYNNFAKQCGEALAYKQHQDIGPDVIESDRNAIKILCQSHGL